jgi:hypothetical protein
MGIPFVRAENLPHWPLGPLAREIQWLTQEISWETLEDLPSAEAAAQITLWTVRWRRLDAAVPEALFRNCRRVLDLLLETCERYPDCLPRIPSLDANAVLDLEWEASAARDLLAVGVAQRAKDGWKEDLLRAARELGIDLGTPREDAERGPEGEAA